MRKVGDIRDRVRWNSAVALPGQLPELGSIVSEQHEMQADPVVMLNE